MRIPRAITLALVACGTPNPATPTVNGCPTLPRLETGLVIELAHHGDDDFVVQLVDGRCPKDAWRGALYPHQNLRCVDVGADGMSAAIEAMRHAGVTDFHVTEARPADVSPHRGGWTMTATWAEGACVIASSWIWEMAPGDVRKFEALRADLGRIRGVEQH